MGFFELFLVAIGLSMDAFAVSICKGLALKRANMKSALIVGLWFGGFQALMPLLGWLLGSRFSQYITTFDHWIAAILLAVIGANMIREALRQDAETADAGLGFKSMLIMAIATSIDALAVGISFAFLNVSILPAVLLIGCITFAISAAGVKIGNVFGTKYKSKAELAGGIILILLGLKILLEHTGLLNF